MSIFALDKSGNSNHWTANNLVTSDVTLDSPTNNFATLNPLDAAANCVLSEGNLKYTTDHSTQTLLKSTFNLTNKHYWEFVISGVGGDASAGDVGIGNPSALSTDGEYATWADNTLIYRGTNGTARDGFGGSLVSYGASFTTGDIIGIALDVPSGTIQFFKNNSSQGTITDSTITTQGNANTLLPVVSNNSTSGSRSFIANFGQDSSFAGNKTAQGETDSNGIGDFYYEPPDEFLALCTSNLPDPAVIPSEHFNTITYSGDSTNRTLTGVSFQSDFTWIKSRTDGSNGSDHWLFDAVRGVNAFTGLCSNGNSVEGESEAGSTQENFGDISAFTSDGFSVYRSTADPSHQYEGVNRSGDTYVAWNWLAGNATLGTGDFTQGSSASTCSRNVDAGFSIVSYTGTGANATVGHGLSKAPEMVIVKCRSVAKSWNVYHSGNTSAPETEVLNLDSTDATYDHASGAYWNDTAPTSTTFALGYATAQNDDTETYIAYCFHSVEGYSKVGSYTGNDTAGGGVDGTFIYTGFRPSVILTKCSSQSGVWMIHDNKRNTYNPVDIHVRPNTSGADDGPSVNESFDFLSNGFKARGSAVHNSNSDGETYIYLAIAEQPFKYSNAR